MAFVEALGQWLRRAGSLCVSVCVCVCGAIERENGSPFARCQILPKVENGGKATWEEEGEEAKMMERPTSGSKEGWGSRDSLPLITKDTYPSTRMPYTVYITTLLTIGMLDQVFHRFCGEFCESN